MVGVVAVVVDFGGDGGGGGDGVDDDDDDDDDDDRLKNRLYLNHLLAQWNCYIGIHFHWIHYLFMLFLFVRVQKNTSWFN